ncbi:MAG TPA: carbamoyltransferase HypF, partial [Acidilobales archaeon]|nr:carbamoyltransferase HypF [Acidilobales archaeon]
MLIALKLIITGIVQGVGFRPFIHRIAIKSNVKGYVRNVGGSEVEVFIEGTQDNISRFLELLVSEKPPPAFIEEIELIESKPLGYQDFRILKSERRHVKRSMIPPDIGICDECLREVLDITNRRFRYPFNSCAWCGPRFSMMYSVPYDRENTAMRKYPLCSECLAEYNDVNNVRRYHAQGISCPKDGPKIWITDNKGELLESKDPLKDIAKLIDEGYIVAIKGLGGYHVAALATDDDVVLKLRKRKRRPQKPFAIMALNLDVARRLVYMTDEAVRILTSPQKPIVLLRKREDSPVSRYVSPGLTVEGIFLPYTALHYLILMESKDKFMIMTSGNAHGKPMCIDEKCVYSKLNEIVDYVLAHDREIVNRVDDSVIRFTDGVPVMLRRGRGFAPTWIRVGYKLSRDVIALGADLQSAGAIGFEDKVVLTQYIGDADDFDILSDLDKYLRFFIRNYSINLSNALIVVDKHPNYASRTLGLGYAKEFNLEVYEVQHHYAHILSVIGERGLIGNNVIGIAIDGAGYGDDGAIWGGEVMEISSNLEYKRIGHLMYHPLIGDVAVKYPHKFLISILLKILNEDEIIKLLNKVLNTKGEQYLATEVSIVKSLINRGMYVNTSSLGRVLDAISVLLGVCSVRTYEGEPAIKLEEYGRGGRLIDGIKVPIRYEEGIMVVDTLSLFEFLLSHLDHNKKSLALTSQVELGRALGDVVVRRIKGRKNI